MPTDLRKGDKVAHLYEIEQSVDDSPGGFLSQAYVAQDLKVER